MHKVVDNFLPDEDFRQIQEVVLDNFFPWYLGHGVAFEDDGDCYFTHSLYQKNLPRSDHLELFAPIFDRLGMDSLIRAKLNLYLPSDKVYEHGLHSDWHYHHGGCVFYFNSCDGYTKLEDGTKIETIENRALLFDASVPHCSTSCTNAPYRITFNCNFFRGEVNPESINQERNKTKLT